MGMYSALIMENNVDNYDILDILDEGLEINTFMEQEYLKLCEEQGLEELAYFEQNKKEIPVNEGDASLKEKSILFIKRIYERMKLYFNKFIVYLNDKFNNDKKFIEKYEGKIKDIDTSNFKYKGYNFTINYKQLMFNVFNKITIFLDSSYHTSYESLLMKMRKIVVSKDTLSDSDFKKELFKMYRGGREEKTDIKIDINNIIDEIKDGDKQKQEITELYNEEKKYIEGKILSDNKKMNHPMEKDKESKNNMGNYISNAKCALYIINEIINALLHAIRDRNNQNRDIVLQLIHNTKKGE